MEDFTVVIFGATGDLTKQKLIPALYELSLKYATMRVVGFARRAISADEFKSSLELEDTKYQYFKDSIQYCQGDFATFDDFVKLKEFIKTKHVLFYLAVAPASYENIIKNLHKSDLSSSNSQIIIEKPFGDDKDSAHHLYKTLKHAFHDEQIYIIDHYLGKETVQNIPVFRFGNPIFESIWNKQYIDNIQITLAESEGISARGGYYDKAGALKDMVQSHALQILASACMQMPLSLDPKEIHQKRKEVLSALHHFNNVDLSNNIIFGQYNGYKSEEKVDPKSTTDTFVALKTTIKNRQWDGVPIFIRTGKKLQKKVSELHIQFKKTTHQIFSSTNSSNILSFRLQPNDGIALGLQVKEIGKSMNLNDISMQYCYSDNTKINNNSYIRLLEDAMSHDRTFFTSIDEIIASWEFIDPLIAYVKKYPSEVITYESGTWGPEQSQVLLSRESRQWISMDNFKCDTIPS